MPANQPTILVKKADGTSVRLTMEEFQKYRASKQMAVSGKQMTDNNEKEKKETKKLGNLETEKLEEKKQEPKSCKLEAKSSEALATSAPVHPVKSPQSLVPEGQFNRVKEIWVDEAIARGTRNVERGKEKGKPKDKKEWVKEDIKPLAEEKVVEKPKVAIAASLPSKRDDVFAQVIKSLKFPVSDELMPRLRSLVISRAKDVRSDDQVREYALRGVESGGLGLDEAQADELMKAIKSQFGVKRAAGEEIKKFRNLEIKKLEEKKDDMRYAIGDRDRKENNRNSSAGKPLMHDVMAPLAFGKSLVGPVEELGAMALVDFRRLASQSITAGKILQGKFDELKSESYLLYLEAIKNWFQSPLYSEYLSVAEQAIGSRKKISEILAGAGKEKLRLEEFLALVEVNEKLSI